MEFLTGTPLVIQKANYALRNSLQRLSRLPESHVLNLLAKSPSSFPTSSGVRPVRPPSENIWIAKATISQLPPLKLLDPVTRIGNRLMDCASRVVINVPSAPPHSSKVFEQWAQAWIQAAYADCVGVTVIGTDGSYKTKGQGVSMYVVQQGRSIICTHSRPVSAHSSYDAEMKAANMAIEFLSEEKFLSSLTTNPRLSRYSTLSHTRSSNFPGLIASPLVDG